MPFFSIISLFAKVTTLPEILTQGRGAVIVVGPRAKIHGVIIESDWCDLKKSLHAINPSKSIEANLTIQDMLLAKHRRRLIWYTRSPFPLKPI